MAAWASASNSLGALEQPIHRIRGEGHEAVVAERDGNLVFLSLFAGRLHVEVAGTTPTGSRLRWPT